MTRETEHNTALGDIRILDLAGPMGCYCTKLLADLGADVVLIEPPEGHAARNIGPFFHDEANPEKSLYFFHFNANKRGVTLNLETAEGRDILKKMVATADMLVETYKPGHMESLGLGYEVLKEINPRLILVSITGFGQTGPYKDFKSCDIVGLAMSGVLDSVGFPEDPPTALACSQAYHMTSTNAAIGALMALYNRDITGKGQWVDIAMQGALLRMSEFGAHMYWIAKIPRKRSGHETYRGVKDFYECKDGGVFCSALGGSGAPEMLEWMESEGMAGELKSEKYRGVIKLIEQGVPMGKGSQQKSRMDKVMGELQETDMRKALDYVESTWAAFLKTHTREELFIGAQTRGVRLMVVREANDIVNNQNLKARDYFVDVAHPELGTSLKYPGAPYRLSGTPWRLLKRAPLLGEHNMEIYEKELGISKEAFAALKATNVL